ncbi:MAG: AMP-binding protein [Pseudonocardiaceae bacterium]
MPIDADYPRERRQFLASDADVVLLITDHAPGTGLPNLDVHTIRPDGGRAETCLREHDVSPENLACVSYNSGSIGTPKVVMITHRGLANLAVVASAEFGMHAEDRYLMLASASFSASLEELFPPVVRGAATVFPPDRAALSAVADLLDFAESRVITLLELQTAQWHLLVRHLAETGRSLAPSART